MTISTTTSRVEYTGNGVTTIFAVPFRFLENAHIVLTALAIDGSQTQLSQGADYTLVGEGDDDGGTATLTVAPQSGSYLIVRRVVPATQETDYISGDPFPAESHEAALDKLTMLVQQGEEVDARTLKFPVGDLGWQVGDLPPAAQRANRVLSFDDAGKPSTAVLSEQSAAGLQLFLAGPSGSSGIGFIQSGTGAVPRTQQAKDREIVAVTDYDTVANAIAATSRSQQSVYVPDGTHVVTDIVDLYGREFEGPGEIVKPDPLGGVHRLNTYTTRYGVMHCGKQFLSRIWKRFALGQSSSLGTLRWDAYGDSTVSGGQGESVPFNITSLVPFLLKSKGLGNVVFTNRGVGGTMVNALDAIPNLSNLSDIISIKYGVNDGGNPLGTRLATFAETLDAKLTEIRAHPFGGLDVLSIVLMAPNSTNDSPAQRDERWYEQLRGIYIAAARKHNCAFYDTYAYMPDSREAAGDWMDDPFGDGRAIHPWDQMQSWIWGGLIDWMFPTAEVARYALNNFHHQGSISDLWSSASAPDQFIYGQHWQRATVANGAPFEGVMMTCRHADQPVMQTLYGYAANVVKIVHRTANIGANNWNRWSGGVVPEPLALSNGWVNYGAPFGTPTAAVDGHGFCHVKGTVMNGTVAPNTVIATLPAGMAPAEESIHVVGINGGTCQLKATPAGEIIVQTAASAGYTSLTMAFKVA